MPLLSVTNLSSSVEVEIQDPSGMSGLSYKVRPSTTDSNRAVTLDQLSHLQPQLDALKAAGHISYVVAEDPALAQDEQLVGSERFMGSVGHNNVGACTLTGAKIGDVVESVVNLTDGTTITASFEAKITVNDQLQQSSTSDLSSKKLLVVLGKRS